MEESTTICLMCLKEYDYLEQALRCEERHRKNEDEYWLKSEEKLSRDRLEKAGNNPNQSHL